MASSEFHGQSYICARQYGEIFMPHTYPVFNHSNGSMTLFFPARLPLNLNPTFLKAFPCIFSTYFSILEIIHCDFLLLLTSFFVYQSFPFHWFSAPFPIFTKISLSQSKAFAPVYQFVPDSDSEKL